MDLLDRGGGPLSGHIERYWFDENKLKTTSIISYAMKPLVKTSGSDSLFSIWENDEKDKMVSDRRRDLLDAYAAFCVSRIDTLLIEARKQLPSGVWSPDKKIAGRILTTTNVNCLLICLRLLILNGKLLDQRYLATSLSSLSVKDFEGFHSSRYRLMAQALYEKHFA